MKSKKKLYNYSFLFSKLSYFTLLFTIGCQYQENIHLRKKIIKKIYPSIVEVIIPKLEDEKIKYQRPLPFDQLDFKERNDKHHAIGTAFFITSKRLISAAHVFPVDEFSVNDAYFIRTNTGSIHKVKTIYRYSTYRDVIEFDLESYPENTGSLVLQSKVEIGDMVYAVGNAQGEGISTRGGQVSTFTPEPIAGVWNYIRFSSPASPGNSGGPLVNSKGEVVGIVVMKNNSENLNFALPVDEIKNAQEKQAHLFARQLKVQDGMQTTTRDWKVFQPLPSTYLALKNKAAPAKNNFYKSLISDFKKDFKSLLFPNNVRFRDSLLYQKLYTRLSVVDKDQALNDWKILPIIMQKVIVSTENILYRAKGEIFKQYVLFRKTPHKTVHEMLQNPRDLTNKILIASGANRYMAGQSIPIIDRGEPDEKIDWTDKLGRPWKTSFWITKYNSTFLVSHCTPSPEGVFCFFDQNFASQKLEGYMDFVEENIIEINLSYTGSPIEWAEFSKMPPQQKPRVLSNMDVSIFDNHLQIKSEQFQWKIPLEKTPFQMRISALINYDPSIPLGIKIQGYQVLLNKNQNRGVTLFQAYETQKLAPDESIERWNQIKEKSGRYDGKFHTLSNQRIMRVPITPMTQTSYLRGEENLSIYSQWWLSCFTPVTFRNKASVKECKRLRPSLVKTK